MLLLKYCSNEMFPLARLTTPDIKQEEERCAVTMLRKATAGAEKRKSSFQMKQGQKQGNYPGSSIWDLYYNHSATQVKPPLGMPAWLAAQPLKQLRIKHHPLLETCMPASRAGSHLPAA